MRKGRGPVTFLGAILLLTAGCGLVTPANDSHGNVTIVVRDVPDGIGTVYIEGSVRYTRITGGGIAPRQWITPPGQTTMKLAPGRYWLAAWERVCDANCDNLDPITNRCALRVDVPEGGATRIVIRWTIPRPCTMVLDS